MKLLLRAAFNRYSGYGNDGIDIARFMSRAGVDVYPWPTTMMPGLPEDFAMLLTKTPLKGAGAYDVALQFLPPFDIRVGKKHDRRISNWGLPHSMATVHAGWSMWEMDKLTKQNMSGHGLGRYPWAHLDTMFVCTQMNIAAFANFDPNREYVYAPAGIDPDGFPVAKRGTDGPTKFCMIGELHQRKDPFVALQAYQELRHEHGPAFNAELHLKTTSMGIPPELGSILKGVYVHMEYWHYQQLIEWMHSMHCYLGPSRGEGNLKPPMEFMATGGTVIATNWSGPTNWLHPDASYPLRYKMMIADKSDPELPQYAKADKDHLKELMWEVHTNRQEASRKGMLAAEWIRQSMSWDKCVGRVIDHLEKKLAEK